MFIHSSGGVEIKLNAYFQTNINYFHPKLLISVQTLTEKISDCLRKPKNSLPTFRAYSKRLLQIIIVTIDFQIIKQHIQSQIDFQEKLKNHLNFPRKIEFSVKLESSSTVYQILEDQNRPITKQIITSIYINILP